MIEVSRHHAPDANRKVFVSRTPNLDKSKRYLCQRCGNCCRWPGDVIVTQDEVAQIAAFLGMELNDFIQTRTRLSANRRHLSLIEKPNGECFFLEGVNTCALQAVKPAQCKGFPNAWRFDGWRDLCEAVEVGEAGDESG